MFKPKTIYFLLSLLLTPFFMFGQSDTATLQDETIDIVKDYIPVVKRASKKHFAPVLPEIKVNKPENQTYTIPTTYEEVDYEPSQLKPLGYPKEKAVDLPFIYLKAGFGNYLTPVIDFQVANKNTEKFRIGVGLEHVSSRRKKIENQIFSETEANVLGEYYIKGVTIGVEPYFTMNNYHFYGYDQSDTSFTKDETRNRYIGGGAKLFVYNHEENDIGLDYKGVVSLHNVKDGYENKEFNFNYEVGLSKTFRELFTIGGNLFVDVNSYKSVMNKNRTAFGLDPYIEVGKDRWKVRGGFWFLINEGTIFIMPDLRHQTKLYKDYIVMYNEWIGHLELNNLRTISAQNPWLTGMNTYAHNRIETRNFIGFKGNIPVGLDYDVRFSQMVYHNTPLFVTSDSLFNKSTIQYDTKLRAWNPHVALGFQYADFLKIRTSFDYFKYNPHDAINMEQAWNLPDFKFNISASYHYDNKLILKADLFAYSAVKALKADGNIEKLKGTVDLNFSANYHLNKNIAFFAQVNNVVSLKHQKYYQYPGYGFLAVGGVILSY